MNTLRELDIRDWKEWKRGAFDNCLRRLINLEKLTLKNCYFVQFQMNAPQNIQEIYMDRVTIETMVLYQDT